MLLLKILWKERKELRKNIKNGWNGGEEHSPLISVMSNLDNEMSPSTPDEQPTQDYRELNNNEGIYDVMM